MKFPLNNCKSCGLGCTFGIGYDGNIETADIVLLGEAPGKKELETGLPFQGESGQLLRKKLAKYNFPFNRTVISNCCICRPPDNRTPKSSEIKACAENIDALLNEIDPKFIIVAGNIPLQRITGSSGITKYRGSIITIKETKVLPIYHPAYILRNPAADDIWDKDIQHLCKLINEGENKQKSETEYYFIETKEELNEMINDILQVGNVSIDIETTGLYFFSNVIRSIQFSNDENKAYFLPILEHLENIKYSNPVEVIDSTEQEERNTSLYHYWNKEDEDYIKQRLTEKIFLNNDIAISGQNFKFDQKFIEHWLFGKDYSKQIRNVIFDTMIASYILDENTPNDLKTNAYLYFDDLRGYANEVKGFLSNKDEDDNDFAKIQLERLLPYALRDAIATFRLTGLFSKKLSEQPFLENWMYNFYIPLHYIYEKAERVGVGIDLEHLNKTRKILEEESLQLEENICKAAGLPSNEEIRKKIKEENSDANKEKIEKLLDKAKKNKLLFNINSSKQLAEILYSKMKLPILEYTESGAPSTKAEVLKELSLDHPYCRDVVKYRNRLHMITNYFDGALKFGDLSGTIVKGFPMTHFTINMIGTTTGRSASKRIAIQTIDRRKDVRMCFCSPPGYLLVEFDLSQIELRLAAWYSQDPTMLQEFKNKVDIHRETTKFRLNLTDDEADKLKKEDPAKYKKIRKRSKLYNFGSIYGGSAKTLMHSINEKLDEDELNEKVTIEDAQRHINFFFKKYYGLKTYYQKVEEFALKNKYVISCYGRIRRLPQLNLPQTQENQQIIAEGIRLAINCVDEKTECLSKTGWKKYNELTLGEEILTKNPLSGILEWNEIQQLNIYKDYCGPMYLFENGSKNGKVISALTTPNHRWLVKTSTKPSRIKIENSKIKRDVLLEEDRDLVKKIKKLSLNGHTPPEISKIIEIKYNRVRGILSLKKRKRKNILFPKMNKIDQFLTSEELSNIKSVKSIHRTGTYLGSNEKIFSDELIEFIGWILTDGSMRYRKEYLQISLTQSFVANPHKVKIIEDVIRKLRLEYKKREVNRSFVWRFKGEINKLLHNIIPHKEITMDFLIKLTFNQLKLLLLTIRLGDGKRITTINKNHLDMFQALVVLCGNSSNVFYRNDVGKEHYSDKLPHGQKKIVTRQPSYHVKVLKREYCHHKSTRSKETYFKRIEEYEGAVWCPTVKNSTIVVRREDNGRYFQFITGQSPIQGTGSDLIKFAMIEMQEWIEQHNMKSILSFDIHDASFALVPEEEIYDYCIKMKEIIEKERPPILREQIDIKCEGKIMRNWGDPFNDEKLAKYNLTNKMLEE